MAMFQDQDWDAISTPVGQGGMVAPPRQAGAQPLIQGRPRQAPPQHPAQAEGDVLGNVRARQQIEQGPTDLARAQTQQQRDALALEREQHGGGINEFQNRSAIYLRNALAAARNYDESGVGPAPLGTALGNAVSPTLMNWLSPSVGGNSPERERANQAELAFQNAVARIESGAANPEPEVVRYNRQYFPTAGSDESTVSQFRTARQDAIRGLLNAAGPAADEQLRRDAEAWLNGGTQPQQQAVAPPQITVPQGQRAATGLDRHEQVVGPQGGDSVQVGGVPETRPVNDPRAAGLNRQIATMAHNNASIGEIGRYLQQRGLSPQEYMPALNRLATFRRQHPNFRSPSPDWWQNSIDFENVPEATGTLERLHNAASDTTLGAAAISAGDTVLGGHLDNVVGLTGGDAEMTNLVMQEMRRRHPYASTAGDIAGAGSLYGAGRAVAGRLAGRALPMITPTLSRGAVAGDAALGGYIGSGQGGTDVFNPTAAGQGALLSGTLGIGGRGAVNTVGRAAAPTGGELAPLYAEGVQPSIGQRMGGVVNRAEQGLASIPFVGGIQRGAREAAETRAQTGAFNQALSEIGDQLPRGVTHGTRAQAYMQNAFNREFGQVRGQMSFAPDNGFAQAFGALQQEAALLTPASQNVFMALANQIGSRLRVRGGRLNGQDYIRETSRLDGKVRALRNNPSGDHELADVLERFSDAVDDAASRQSAPELAQRLANARRGYVRAVIIEDAARRRGGEAGTFSPRAFDSAVQKVSGGVRSRQFLRGEAPMQDYSQSMLRLGQTIGDSGTAERMMTMGSGAAAVGATGAGSLLGHPVFAAPWALNTAANLRGVRNGVNWAIKPGRSITIGGRSFPINSPRARKFIQSLGPGASAVGGGSVPTMSQP